MRRVRALLLALVLSPPVAGPAGERFSYAEPFERGAHRGMDFVAAPGAVVRSACDGVVVHAGPVAGEGVMSVRCGAHRVSLVGVRASVRRGARVQRGDRVGRALGEVHLGVRLERDRFAYLDPERFLRVLPRVAPPAGPGAPLAPLRPRAQPHGPRAAPPAGPGAPLAPLRPRAEPHGPRAGLGAEPHGPLAGLGAEPHGPLAAPGAEPHGPRAAPAAGPAMPLAPWPAWLGLALALAGAVRAVRRPPIASVRRWPSTSRRRSTT
jgi:hypothetical protein